MITYGLIVGVVGTLICVTAEKPSMMPYEPVCGTDGKTYSHLYLLVAKKSEGVNLDIAHPGECKHDRHVRSVSSPCPKEVKEVCGTDGVTYANFCMLDQAHTLNESVTLSHLGLCNNKTVEEQANVTSGVINATEKVFNKTTEAVEEFKDVQKSKNSIKAQNLRETSNVEDLERTIDDDTEAMVKEDSEEAIELEDTSDVQQTKQGTDYENITIIYLEDLDQAQNLKMPIVEKNAAIEVEAKNESISTNTSDANECENDQNGKKKTKSDGQSVNENIEKSKDVNKSEKSRQRRDVNNADENGNHKDDAKLDRKFKDSKNKNGKSVKQRNQDNVSFTKTGEEQTNTEDKVEQTPKDTKNNSEKSRNRRDVSNLADGNDNHKGDAAKLGGKFKVSKNKNGKSIKQRNEDNASYTKTGEEQTTTEDKVERTPKDAMNKLEKSRKRRDVQNVAEKSQRKIKHKMNFKNSKKDVRNEKNKPHKSRKQRDVNEKYGKNKQSQKSKHIERADSKTNKGGQKPNHVS